MIILAAPDKGHRVKISGGLLVKV